MRKRLSKACDGPRPLRLPSPHGSPPSREPASAPPRPFACGSGLAGDAAHPESSPRLALRLPRDSSGLPSGGCPRGVPPPARSRALAVARVLAGEGVPRREPFGPLRSTYAQDATLVRVDP
jgi:hypothetical protein